MAAGRLPFMCIKIISNSRPTHVFFIYARSPRRSSPRGGIVEAHEAAALEAREAPAVSVDVS